MDRSRAIALAQEAALSFAEGEPEIVGAYLTGSIATGQYLRDPDVDIILVWNRPTVLSGPQHLLLAEGFALELAYRPRPPLEATQTLLADPILAGEIATAILLYDPTGFLAARQAAIRPLWQDPHWRCARARAQSQAARQLLPIVREELRDEAGGEEAAIDYIRFLVEAGAVLPVLAGALPTYRRHLLLHREVALRLGRPDLHTRLLAALGASRIAGERLQEWIAAMNAMGDHISPRAIRQPQELALYQAKKRSYNAGLRDLLEQGWVAEAVLPCVMVAGLYRGLIARYDPPEAALVWETRWQAILAELGLWPPCALMGRIPLGAHYLEAVDEIRGEADGSE